MLTDEMLTAQILAGEISAFEELINRYKKSVFTIVYRMTGQYQDAEDISQEVFLAVYQKLYQFDTQKKFAPWIHRIAVNTCISALRRKNKFTLINYDESLLSRNNPTDPTEHGNPLAAVERRELQAEIQAALRQLPANYQAVLVLRYQLDLNNQEIADTLGATKKHVEVNIHRARKTLQKILTKKSKGEGMPDALPGG